MAEPIPPLAGRVLLVCTGNIGRSPYMERRLRQLAAPALSITSAGTRAATGQNMEARMAAALGDVGADVRHFTARQLSSEQILRSDLILTATGEHLGALARVSPVAITKALTLRHAARILASVPNSPADDGRAHSAGELRRWLMTNRWRARSDSSLDDLVDPYAADDVVAEQSVEAMESALQIIAASLRA